MMVTGVLALLVALVAPATVPAGTPGGHGVREPGTVMPFITDDYTRAVAEARARKVPLFIEAWAPW